MYDVKYSRLDNANFTRQRQTNYLRLFLKLLQKLLV